MKVDTGQLHQHTKRHSKIQPYEKDTQMKFGKLSENIEATLAEISMKIFNIGLYNETSHNRKFNGYPKSGFPIQDTQDIFWYES